MPWINDTDPIVIGSHSGSSHFAAPRVTNDMLGKEALTKPRFEQLPVQHIQRYTLRL